MKFLTGIVISALLTSSSILAADQAPFPAIQAGSDFCLLRQYDVGHLSHNPKQLITSLQIMGRNAWRTHGSSANLDASLRVSFRDTSKTLLMNGSCWHDSDKGKVSNLQCKFVPALSDFADLLQQGLYLKDLGSEQIQVEATSDWRVIRVNKEPDALYGAPAADDRVFILAASPVSACDFSREFWSSKGPTRKFEESLP